MVTVNTELHQTPAPPAARYSLHIPTDSAPRGAYLYTAPQWTSATRTRKGSKLDRKTRQGAGVQWNLDSPVSSVIWLSRMRKSSLYLGMVVLAGMTGNNKVKGKGSRSEGKGLGQRKRVRVRWEGTRSKENGPGGMRRTGSKGKGPGQMGRDKVKGKGSRADGKGLDQRKMVQIRWKGTKSKGKSPGQIERDKVKEKESRSDGIGLAQVEGHDEMRAPSRDPYGITAKYISLLYDYTHARTHAHTHARALARIYKLIIYVKLLHLSSAYISGSTPRTPILIAHLPTCVYKAVLRSLESEFI